MKKGKMFGILTLVIVVSLAITSGYFYNQWQSLVEENQTLKSEKDVLEGKLRVAQENIANAEAPYLINVEVEVALKQTETQYGQNVSLWRIGIMNGYVLNAGLVTAQNVRFKVVAYNLAGEEIFSGETQSIGNIGRYEFARAWGGIVTDLTTDTFVAKLTATPICDNMRK